MEGENGQGRDNGMKEIVDTVLEQNKRLLETPWLHEKRITVIPSRGSRGSYTICLEGLYGSTPEVAREYGKIEDSFLTAAGYSQRRTLRHPLAGEFMVFCTEDDVARTESEEIAGVIAYSLACEHAKMIAHKLGYGFEDKTKGGSDDDE